MSVNSIIKRRPFRVLQTFAFDPSLQTEMERRLIQKANVEIPWEDWPGDIKREGDFRDRKDGPAPGPVGEYIEVIDYNPVIGEFYQPVDLNNPYLLDSNGLEPSVGNPCFHQQMVYAVAMKTIKIFEKALGRAVFWSPRDSGDDKGYEYVQRLRIYPHAFEDANAFYSPEKKALLFGYFKADSSPNGDYLPGGLVFSCLSHDIIVHELSHALLDGIHRRFTVNSNPDVLAFHEAFADIMALFQHFTYPEVVRHELARSRGEVSNLTILGDLAKELGKAIGRSAALRRAIGEKPDPKILKHAMEPHKRGAVLVAAVFKAFVMIYNNRTRDLFRIAGINPVRYRKELSKDLLNRLAREAAKSAEHMLGICIRALDYLPPMDITFGDYLRALITADTDIVANDDHGYRVAFISAFKEHGIYPSDVNSLAEDSLIWDRLEHDEGGCFSFIDALRDKIVGWEEAGSREALWKKIQFNQEEIHEKIKETWRKDAKYFRGISIENEDSLFEVHSVRPVRRVGPDENIIIDMLVEIIQKRPGYFDRDMGGLSRADRKGDEDFWFRGGCTILVDLYSGKLRYCIYKDIGNKIRYERQQHFEMDKWNAGAARMTFFRNYYKSVECDLFSRLHKGPDRLDSEIED